MEEPGGGCPRGAQSGAEGVGRGCVGPLDLPEPAASQRSRRWGRPGRGGQLGPGCRLPFPSPPVLAAPMLPSWPRPRPDTCSHTRPCQAWPCSLQTWPCPATRRHAPSHTPPGLRPSTHDPLVLFFGHSCTSSPTHRRACLETQTRPWPTTSLGQLPAGPHE